MNRRMHGVLPVAFACLALGFMAGCGSSNSNTTKTPPTVSIAATSGGGQSAAVGAAFASPFSATVTSNGAAASGVSVTFTAPATEPNGTFAGGAASDTETTNASGVATSKAFTAGTKAGSYSVSATATGATGTASFSVSNAAGAAAGISASGGATQSATVSTAFATALQATVVDSDNNPVSGAMVTFKAPASGASGTFATSGTATETDTTGSNGVATASTFKANATTGGPYTVTANFSGNTGAAASFSLTNTAAPVPVIAVTSGSGQSAVVSTAFANPLVATVTLNGAPASGVSVTFTAPASGASGKFTNGTNTEIDTTNTNGTATTSAFTANATTGGPYTVAATTAGATSAANFSLTNTAAAAPVIAVSSGSGQSATVSTAFTNKLVALVTTNGTPANGVSVTFTAPSTGASGTFGNGTATETDTTNSSGLATSSTFTANATAGGPYNVAATATGATSGANFSLTNTPGPKTFVFWMSGQEFANANNTNVISYYALAGAVRIDANGNVLSGEQDYNDGDGITSPQPSGDSITGGTLTVSTSTGQGTLTLTTNNTKVGVAGKETFAVQFANANHALITQFDGSATSSGSMDLQTAGTPSGNFAYTLEGVDSSYNQTAQGGVFTISGTSMTGTTDQNDFGTVTSNQAFTATVTAEDALGRGSVSISGSTNVFRYYVVGPEVMRLVLVNAKSSAAGSAFGQGAVAFSSASLGTSVMALAGSPWANGNGTLAQFTTSNHSSNPSSFAGVGDDNEQGNGIQSAAAAITGTYTVAANGVGSMSVTSANLGSVASLKIYMVDPLLNVNDPNNPTGGGGALVLDMDKSLPSTTGVIVPQTNTATASVTGGYAMGAQDINNFFAPNCTECEFDMVAQGTITGGVLSANGDVSDPLTTLITGSGLYPGSTFNGILPADATHPGRYSKFAVSATINGKAGTFNVVVYQASGGQLYWLEVDTNGMWVGPLEQQGSLSSLP